MAAEPARRADGPPPRQEGRPGLPRGPRGRQRPPAGRASGYERTVRELLAVAGVEIGGARPWDVQVHDPAFYRRVLAAGSLGLGESYMDGQWDCQQLDELSARLNRHHLVRHVARNLPRLLQVLRAKLVTRWGRDQVFRRVAPHYDLGNDLFEKFLDTEYMAYTCAYWRRGAQTLEQAQEDKLRLVAEKLGLEPGMRVLDLGCGWGPFARFAAREYGVSVLGVTLSKEQAELGNRRCAGLPVELRVADYREVGGTFERVVSIGCLEHVGHRNHRRFFRQVHDRLADDGIALVHSIGVIGSQYMVGGFIDHYVFPLVNLPSIAQIGRAIDGLLVLEDLHNIGPDYERTLLEWNRRFQAAWPELEARYGGLLGGRFKRMFEFYLLGCAGFSRARGHQVWQMVLTKARVPQPPCRVS